MFSSNSFKVPDASKHDSLELLPYHLVGDEIFPLKTWLMRPYPGQLSEEQRIFNYRLSRARRTIENTFGILAARWRLFHKPIRSTVANAEKYTLACVALHNYLRLTDNAAYCPAGFVDSTDDSGVTKEGDWRTHLNEQPPNGLVDIRPVRGSRYSQEAVSMRVVKNISQ